MIKHSGFLHVLATAGAVLLSACAYSPDISQRTIAFNEAISESTNQLFLLNAIRASKREPTYYSRLQGDTATSTYTPQFNMGVPLGSEKSTLVPGAKTLKRAALSLTPQLTTTLQNALTLTNMDDQASINGLKSLVSLDVVNRFLSEGWPAEELYLLYLSDIRIMQSAFEKLEPTVVLHCSLKPASSRNHYCNYFFGNRDCIFPESDPDREEKAGFCQIGLVASYRTKRLPDTYPDEDACGSMPKDSKRVLIIRNDPALDRGQGISAFGCFQQTLRALLALDLAPSPKTTLKGYYQASTGILTANPSVLAEWTQQGLEVQIDPVKQLVAVCKTSKELSLKLGIKLQEAEILDADYGRKAAQQPDLFRPQEAPATIELTSAPVAKPDCVSATTPPLPSPPGAPPAPEPTGDAITATPRSLEGMVYFLGQNIRRTTDLNETTGRTFPVTFLNAFGGPGKEYEQILFAVDKGLPPQDAFASVAHRGEWYSIPNLCADLSVERACETQFPNHAAPQILTFLNQVWGLNKSAAVLPPTANVTIVQP
jgi:hypothetical protein